MTTTPTIYRAQHQANLPDDQDEEDPAIIDIGMGRYVVVYSRLVAADGTIDLVTRSVSAAGVVGAELPLINSPAAVRNADVDVLANGRDIVVFEQADNGTLTDFDPWFFIRDQPVVWF